MQFQAGLLLVPLSEGTGFVPVASPGQVKPSVRKKCLPMSAEVIDQHAWRRRHVWWANLHPHGDEI